MLRICRVECVTSNKPSKNLADAVSVVFKYICFVRKLLRLQSLLEVCCVR